MSKLISEVVENLKLSVQTKTFWVSTIGGLIAVGEAFYIALGHTIPSGLTGQLVTAGNGLIAVLVGLGLVKNTSGDDLDAQKEAKQQAKLNSVISSLGIEPDTFKAALQTAEQSKTTTNSDATVTPTTEGGETSETQK